MNPVKVVAAIYTPLIYARVILIPVMIHVYRDSLVIHMASACLLPSANTLYYQQAINSRCPGSGPVPVEGPFRGQ
ncbi:hypothetical protein ASPTUDRAFT_585276 [Aspergillus tubingensis CBS 134.48]|uniref:Uncharacterized protein n=1 Tax=Aspergillus tubingensis (strain CBS 134.48) TaxID=767770 RepID=A0A1L9N8D1_ASPTC|nr:hypothetical protein ASPTUDRAFT_585276 [Aspergillus tubingensis CBS 134.48]